MAQSGRCRLNRCANRPLPQHPPRHRYAHPRQRRPYACGFCCDGRMNPKTVAARPLAPDEILGEFADYITPVIDDMLSLSANIVQIYAREWRAKLDNPGASTPFSADRTAPQLSDLYVRLLVDFSTQDPE